MTSDRRVGLSIPAPLDGQAGFGQTSPGTGISCLTAPGITSVTADASSCPQCSHRLGQSGSSILDGSSLSYGTVPVDVACRPLRDGGTGKPRANACVRPAGRAAASRRELPCADSHDSCDIACLPWPHPHATRSRRILCLVDLFSVSSSLFWSWSCRWSRCLRPLLRTATVATSAVSARRRSSS